MMRWDVLSQSEKNMLEPCTATLRNILNNMWRQHAETSLPSPTRQTLIGECLVFLVSWFLVLYMLIICSWYCSNIWLCHGLAVRFSQFMRPWAVQRAAVCNMAPVRAQRRVQQVPLMHQGIWQLGKDFLWFFVVQYAGTGCPRAAWGWCLLLLLCGLCLALKSGTCMWVSSRLRTHMSCR